MMSDYNSLIKKYTEKLREDPRSRTFAPLGEIYRKLGLYKQAISVYEAGIKVHPTYSLGIIGLAQCYFEIDEYQLSYNVLKPYLNLNNDNLKYLNLYASVCEKLNYIDEALKTYKNILFISPRDEKAKQFINRFEDDSISAISYVDEEPFELDALDTGLNEWSQLNLLDPLGIMEDEEEAPELNDQSEQEDTKESEVDDKPLFSHTLVDLYVDGGAIEKAIEILESALENNPDDARSVERLEELKASLENRNNKTSEISIVASQERDQEDTEEDDHDNLMKVFDQNVAKLNSLEDEENTKKQSASTSQSISEADVIEKVEMAYSLFLSHINKKSNEYLR